MERGHEVTYAPEGRGSVSNWDYKSGAGWSEAGADTVESPASDSGHPFDVEDAGRYRLGPTIGLGGMGKVRVAWDQRLKRDVAYKEVRREATGDVSRRLAREAWITATLEHPGIVPVHDAGRDGEGRLFYTMRMVRGHGLDRALEEAADRLDLLRSFLVVCETVAYAHSVGVVHRDLKPANIMVGQFGEVQVVDWGLAARIGETDSHPPDALEPADDRLTQVGAVIGTPAYMSPEQARGEPVSVGADVWSLGAILYELLTGAPPFSDDGATTTLERARQGVIQPVMARAADAPPALAAVAQRALDAEPSQRYSDAAALAQEVARFLDGRQVNAYSYSSRELLAQLLWVWRAPVGVAAAALLVLAIVTGVGVERIRQERNRAVRSEATAASALERANVELARTLTEQAVQAARRDVRPEAERLAAASLLLHDTPVARGVMARFAARPAPVPIRAEPLPECHRKAMFGAQLLCLNKEGTSLWDSNGERRWISSQPPWKERWVSEAHDAVLLASHWDRRLVLLSATDGSVRRTWTDLYRHRDVNLLGQPGSATVLWMDETTAGRIDLSDGTVEAMAPMCPEGEPMRLAARNPRRDGVVAVCGRGHVRVTTVAGEELHEWWMPWEGFTAPVEIAWMESPEALAVATYGGELLLRDVATGEVIQSPVELGMRPISMWAGRLLAVAGSDGGIRLRDLHTDSWAGWLPAWSGDVVSVSEDGRFVRTAGEELVTWDLGSQRQTLVFDGEGGLGAAVPSRDENWLAITGADGAAWLSSVETGERKHVAPNQPWDMGQAAFNIDQTALYVPTSGKPGLMRLDLERGVWSPVGNERAYRRVGALADGSMIAVPEGRDGVEFIETDGTLVQGGADFVGEFYDLAVTDDGSTALLASVHGALWHVSARTRRAVQLFEIKVPFALAIDPDAGTIALGTRNAVLLFEPDGTERSTFDHGGKLLLDLALSPDGRWVAVADSDGSVYVYRQQGGSLAAVLPYHSDAVRYVGFARNGHLFSASSDGTALRYDLSNLEAPVSELVESVRASWGTGPLAETTEAAVTQSK